MEFPRRAWGPTLDSIRALPLNARLLAAAAGLIIVVGLLSLLRTSSRTEYEPLLEGRQLAPPEIAKMAAAFQKHGLHEAQISFQGIEIPRQQKDAYLVALDTEQAWPADFDEPVEQALAGTSALMPWQQNRESLQRGEKQMLARILEGMTGIETAAVQYDEVRLAGFPPRSEMRAMVAIRAVGRRDLEYEEIEAVRDTVVAFKSGLERCNVTVTDLNACRAYPGSLAADASHAAARARSSAKRALEEDLRAKIEQRLAVYPGRIVAVHAHFESSGPEPSTDDNPPSPIPLRLVLVTASIDLPKSYFRTVWQQRRGVDSAPAADELADIEGEICTTIEKAVSAMLPPPAPGWDHGPLVTVTSHDELPLPSAGDAHRLAPLPRAVAYSLPVVVIAILLLAAVRWRNRSRSRAGACQAVEFDASRAGQASSGPEPDERTEPGFVALQDQLAKLVKQDPAAAAEVLKQWLNRAA